MAKYKEEVDLNHSMEVVLNALQALHEAEDSRLHIKGAYNGIIYIGEHLTSIQRLGWFPIDIKLRMRPLSDVATKMTIESSEFGPGPLHARSAKTKAQRFRQELGPHLQAAQAAADAVVQGEIASGVRCPQCGATLPPGTRFCPNDGTQIARACANCSAINAPGARFCVGCGRPL